MNNNKMTNYRWYVCAMLFFATTVNYLDRQVLSLTWKDFISPEFGWTDAHYGTITGCFSFVYSIAMFFAGRTVDFLGIKKGYSWAIALWSLGACLHAFCGIATAGIVLDSWSMTFAGAREHIEIARNAGTAMMGISTVSMWLFLIARCVLATGEAGNFPCANKTISAYFPQKDRAFATSLFNSGSQIGAMLAPFTIPVIARFWGWEMSFLIIGLLGFVWLGIWLKTYDAPDNNKRMNKLELDYIRQDEGKATDEPKPADGQKEKINIFKYFTYRHTWAIFASRFLPEGVWWFFLFWAPAYVKDIYGYSSDSFMGMILIFALYLITMLSIIGGYLPTFLVNKKGFSPFGGRMTSMFVYSLFPLLGIIAPFLGVYSCWFPIIIIGIIGAAHQSWSANAYSLVSDLFPKSVVATLTGLAGMVGGLGSFLFNQGSGLLFTYSRESNMSFMGFEGIQAGYMIVFLVASVAYILSWFAVKSLTSDVKK